MTRLERLAPLSGVVAVVLWIVGLLVIGTTPSDKASDATVLAHFQHHASSTLAGSWVFMIGCAVFVGFVGLLRGRFAEAEGGQGTLANISFGGAVGAAVFAIGTVAGQLAIVLNKDHTSASTAGAMFRLGTAMFVGGEMLLVVLFAAASLVAYRTRMFPRWWAVLMGLLAVVLLIGPIGWLAVIFGVPIWTLGTTYFLLRRPAEQVTAAPAAA